MTGIQDKVANLKPEALLQMMRCCLGNSQNLHMM
jgi:hypothetical protein